VYRGWSEGGQGVVVNRGRCWIGGPQCRGGGEGDGDGGERCVQRE
jgi:hypothetical protein